MMRPCTSAAMSQHIGKLYRSAVSSFIFFLVVDVGVTGGGANKENAAAVTHVTAQPLLLTPEPWNLLVTQTPAKEKAKEGETVTLNCHLNSPQHPSLTDLMVKWYKEDEKGQMDLLEKNVTILPNNSRIFMSGDLSQGDVSLIILNVTISDHGLFGIEESIGTIIGVVAAGIGGIVVLIIVLTPQLRKCILCMRQESRQSAQKSCSA
ncbi:PREDICTED: uncharacterized protein LOC106628238 isoform X3 [Pseudopodoces humilis]|uniref:uncharacterized protein LOC106628238 isoform X3 n=1 Tax=Pseudopodoces humilis TaxID=181119 RepID=UPI0006B6E670|nr:PREDICTED: uncharacterized protein LOC106628238 isoform X3 [Pseudopodoces humilis]